MSTVTPHTDTTPHTEIINDLLRLAVGSGARDVMIKSSKLGYVRLSNKLK
jgi:twitching motility protein PilT